MAESRVAPVFCETEAGAELLAGDFPTWPRILPIVEKPDVMAPGIIGIPGRDDDRSNVCCGDGKYTSRIQDSSRTEVTNKNDTAKFELFKEPRETLMDQVTKRLMGVLSDGSCFVWIIIW